MTHKERVKERLTYHFKNTDGSWNLPQGMPFMKEFLNEVDKLVSDGASGTEYLYDKINKREVHKWYKDSDGNPLIDLDPFGVNMSGKRTVKYADSERYEFRYR
jgi:hypothetical protein